ncbi:sce7726 family protein [Calothrix sp. FACHB-1219]|uniref:sce7726 family protein n=1 Tax=Calothrix sp. FACHB-1219 TaxID=2692778 RepID=UPI00168A10E3|nr:sce7726 family protein [Calothrix sp. FACHB-1219]MBD2222870.1 sce7726 family protein [Calothrix sp. FACHB-1219]
MTTNPLSASELRQLMQAFTRPVFNEMGRGLVPKAVSRAAELVGAAGSPLGAALQLAYERLRKCYRAEYIYKNEIASKVVFAKHSPRTASLVSELRVGDCILDLAVFNGTSTAYEIKTQYDSLARLPEQLGEYLQVFDKVFVVTHLDGVAAALKSAPSAAGVMALNGRGSLTTVREASSNASRVDPVAVFRTLRQLEFLRILAKTHGWDGTGVPRGVLHAQALARFKELPPELAHELAVFELRKRTSAPELVEFLAQLPACLRTLGLSEPLSGVGKRRLLDLLTVCA